MNATSRRSPGSKAASGASARSSTSGRPSNRAPSRSTRPSCPRSSPSRRRRLASCSATGRRARSRSSRSCPIGYTPASGGTSRFAIDATRCITQGRRPVGGASAPRIAVPPRQRHHSGGRPRFRRRRAAPRPGPPSAFLLGHGSSPTPELCGMCQVAPRHEDARARRARVVPPRGERGRARWSGGPAGLGEARARPRRQEAPAVRATKAED